MYLTIQEVAARTGLSGWRFPRPSLWSKRRRHIEARSHVGKLLLQVS